LLYQFAKQTHFPRDKPRYPGLGKVRKSSCPYSVPPQGTEGREGSISPRKVFFSCPNGEAMPFLALIIKIMYGSKEELSWFETHHRGGVSELGPRAIPAWCIRDAEGAFPQGLSQLEGLNLLTRECHTQEERCTHIFLGAGFSYLQGSSKK